MKKIIKLTESQLKSLIHDILKEEEDYDFTTKQTEYDPEKGTISWDITYTTNLKKTYKEIDEAVKRLEEILEQNRGDKEAIELLKLSRTLRNKFSRFMTKR